MRERKFLVKHYNSNKDPQLVTDIRKIRNKSNTSVEKAKSEYVRNILGATKKDPNKF